VKGLEDGKQMLDEENRRGGRGAGGDMETRREDSVGKTEDGGNERDRRAEMY